MMRQSMVLGVLLCGSIGAYADYPADRVAALKLVRAGNARGALEAFLKMADGAEGDAQKADALEQAALCAQQLKQEDQALDLAKKIPLEIQSKACQIVILGQARRGKELIEQFGAENMEGWPRTLAGDAYLARGRAFHQAGQGEKAVADLKKAAQFVTEANHKGLALNTLGDVYRDLIKDNALALESYRKVYDAPAINKQCYAAAAVARILAGQGKFDEAFAELNRIDMAKVTHTDWQVFMVLARGDVLARQGKKREAADTYMEALKVEGISSSDKAACDKKLKELE